MAAASQPLPTVLIVPKSLGSRAVAVAAIAPLKA